MKKRTLALLCALVLTMATLIPVAAMAETWKAYVYTSNGGSLNLRKAPVTHTDNKLANIPYGTEVTILEYVNNRTWAYVQYDNLKGYVMTRYLSSTKPNDGGHGGNSTPTTETVDISFAGFEKVDYTVLVRPTAPGGYVNLRWAPSKKVAVYERVYDGQTLEVIAQNNHWAQVRDPQTGAVGFMMRSFLTVTGNGAIGTGATAN